MSEVWTRIETETGLSWVSNIDKYQIEITYRKHRHISPSEGKKDRLFIVVRNAHEICDTFSTWLDHDLERAREIARAMVEIAVRQDASLSSSPVIARIIL